MKTKKHHSRQVDIAWDQPEPFQLAIDQTLDGDRIANEQTQQEQDRHDAEQNQTTFA